MKRKYTVTPEQSEEIKEYRKKVKEKNLNKRLYAVQLIGEGKTAAYIEEKLDCRKQQISRWVKQFCENGIDGLLGKCGGRHHENMSIEDEKEILKPFEEKAEKGQLPTAKDIKTAYEAKIGKKVCISYIYKFLHRHDFRKIMPRRRHPKKASDEEINSSKKLTQKSQSV